MHTASCSTPKNPCLELVESALKAIEDGLEDGISVASITRGFERSHWQFQRMFRGVVGVTIGTYLRERRLSEAAQALRETSHRVLDVAVQYRFESQEAFARAFKRHFGVSPTVYRKNDNLVLTQARKRVTRERLHYFWNRIQRTPTLVELPEQAIVGKRVDFNSHFIEGKDCADKVLPHWLDFLKSVKSIENRVGDDLIGVALSSELDLRQRKLSYLSGVKVSSPGRLARGMEVVKIPAGLYACFENTGVARERPALLDYVYGIWLPTSGLERALGYDFEVFDRRYQQTNDNSFSKAYIPIKNVKKRTNGQNGNSRRATSARNP